MNSFAVVSGGYHTNLPDTRQTAYIARRVRLYVGGTSLILDNPVGNDLPGLQVSDLRDVRHPHEFAQ